MRRTDNAVFLISGPRSPQWLWAALAVSAAAAPAAAQVLSSAPTAAPTGSYLGSARMQYGISQPASYQGAVLGGGQITSPLQAGVVAAGGITSSTNPPFWSQTANNAFTLSYSAATQQLTLTVRRPNNNIQFSISDSVNMAGAQGLTLGFLSTNASQYSISQVTAGGTAQSIGPAGGTWSDTSLRNSMLTGWDMTGDWSMSGSIRLLNNGLNDDPRLQADVITDGLGYQLSSQGAGRPAVYNYGTFQQMVVTDAQFQQAQYGGVNGVVQANIYSRGAVTFNIAGTAELAGGVFDLDSPLAPVPQPAFASLVKQGAGTLLLTGTNAYTGTTTIEDGTLGIVDATGIGLSGLIFGNGSGAGTPILQYNGSSATAMAGGVTLNGSSGTFDVTDGQLGLYGAVSEVGSQGITKTGAGTLVLGLSGGYSGLLSLQGGTTVLQNAASMGGAGLTIGTATMELDTDLTMTATQAFSVTGDALVTSAFGSALALDSAVTSAAGDSLTLQNLQTTFTGNGAGLLGGLTVDQGTFTMNGRTIGSDVTATNGAIFDATGTVSGNLSAISSTIKASGGDPTVAGTLSVSGNMTLDSHSTFMGNVFLTESAPGQRVSDRANVAGTATMGGTLDLVLNTAVSPGSIVPGKGVSETWRVISTSAGTGSFTAAQLVIVNPLAGTSGTIVLPINGTRANSQVLITTAFDATGATVTLLGLGGLPPDAQVATACGTVSGADINAITSQLILVANNGNSDAMSIANDLLLQPDAVLPPAYSATQQQNPYATPNVVMDSNFMAGQTAMLRLMQMRDGAMGAAAGKVADAAGGKPVDMTQPSAIGSPLNGPTPDADARPWMRGYGFWENVDEENCSQCGYDASIGGAMAGMDWAIDGGGIVGAFAGLGPGVVNINGWYGHEQDNVTDVMFGLYGSLVPKGGVFYAEGFLMGGYTSVDRARTIALPDASQRLATSSNDAWSLTAGGEKGFNLSIGERSWLQPYLGLSWSNYWGGSYSETGAQSLDLTVNSQSCSLFQPSAGARILHSTMIGRDMLTPYVGLAFLAQLPTGGWAPTYTSDFNLGAPTQNTSGPPDRYGGNVQAGVEFATVKGVTAYIAFDGAVMTDKQRFGGQVGVFVPF